MRVCVLTVIGRCNTSYTLQQFHTHTPSEHKVAGRHYDMEMQFVHSAEVDGVTKLAVIACFYERGDRSPSFVKKLMRDALPKVSADAAPLAQGLDFRVRSLPRAPLSVACCSLLSLQAFAAMASHMTLV